MYSSTQVTSFSQRRFFAPAYHLSPERLPGLVDMFATPQPFQVSHTIRIRLRHRIDADVTQKMYRTARAPS